MLEILIIIFFFIIYQCFDIYFAIYILILSNFVILIFSKIKTGKFNRRYIFAFIFVLIFGLATIYFKNDFFIKLKVTVIYWLLSLLCLSTHIFGYKPFIKYLIDKTINLPDNIWIKLNKSCSVFFILIGLINLFIMFNYSTDVWIKFKLFGIISLNIIFVFYQYFFIFRYINFNKVNKDKL